MFSESARVTVSKELVSCDMDEDAVILNLKDGEYHELNAMGARIWELIQEPQSVADLKAVILAEYDVDAETCERDVQDLLRSMVEKELVQVDSQESA